MTKSTIRESQPTKGIFRVPSIDCRIKKAMAPPARLPNRAPAGTIFKTSGTTNAPMMNTAPPMKWASTPTLKASWASPVVLYTGSMMEYSQMNIRPACRPAGMAVRSRSPRLLATWR